MTFKELPYTDKTYPHRTVDVPYHNCPGFELAISVINATADRPQNLYFLCEDGVQIYFCPFCGQKL